MSSVELDAATTCASIRAGLSRPALLDGPVVLSVDDYREIPVTSHPVPSLARGFSNVGRWLQLIPPALSRSGCWWSAVAGGHWEAAREIARLSRTSHNPDCEHEDDFLYVMFLMQQFFLAPPVADTEVRKGFEGQQAALLARRRVVLEGGEDSKLDLCEALQNRDAEAFQDALLRSAHNRRVLLNTQDAEGNPHPELALWLKPIWVEGLGLLRLAELAGLGADFTCPEVPPLIRIPPPLHYDPNAWRNLDFKLAR